MSLLGRSLPALLLLAAPGCEKDLVNDTPDAAVDSVPLLDGDFSCVGTAWPTDVRDPFPISGVLVDWNGTPIGGANAGVYDAETDTLLAEATSSVGGPSAGKWGVTIPTAMVARKIYRKLSAAGFLDSYGYDAFAEFLEWQFWQPAVESSRVDAWYQMAGMTPDPSKGVAYLRVWDCNAPSNRQSSQPVVGATIDAPDGATVIYWDDQGNPDPSLTSTHSFAGGEAGAVIVGIPPGTTDFVIHAGPITYRSWPIDVHANAITVSQRHP